MNLKKNCNEEFLNLIPFSINKQTYRKNAISKILMMFRDIDKKHNEEILVFQGVLRQFFSELTIFLKTVFNAEICINHDRKLCR